MVKKIFGGLLKKGIEASAGSGNDPGGDTGSTGDPGDGEDLSPSTLAATKSNNLSSVSSEEENDAVNSLLPGSYRTSSLFSHGGGTFGTASTAPTSSLSAGSQPGPKPIPSSATVGAGVSQIDSIGRPLRVLRADKYNELQRTGTSTSVHSTSPSSSYLIPRRRRSDIVADSSTGVTGGLGESPQGSGSTMTGGSASLLGGLLSADQIEKELFLLNENLLGLIDQLNQSVVNVSKASILLVEFLDECIPIPLPTNVTISLQNNENLRSVLKIILQFYDNHLRFEVYKNSKSLIIRTLKEFLSRVNFKFGFSSSEPLPFVRNFAIVSDQINTSTREKVEMIIEKISGSNSTVISDQQGSFIAPVLRGLSKSTSILSIMFGFPDPQSDHYDIINALFQTFPDVHFFIVKDFIKPCAHNLDTTFRAPFRIPTNGKPEISISISSENGLKSSGTLGGYIEPKLTSTTDDSLLRYKGSKFALTCAHVLLSEDQDYPNVCVPSMVLIKAYKNALKSERDEYEAGSIEYNSYNNEFTKIDKVATKFGQVVWGERTLINNKISDIAIVKVNEGLKVENFLGNGIDRFNAALKFKNLYIKKKIPTKLFSKYNKVFKIGANTNYTTGEINGIKMIYWLDGSLQTSEFILASPEPMFANNGDSGSLIFNNLPNETGLGVIGMLHSYDGELKQLGLFTPIEDVLNRLHEVTGVEWDFCI